MANTCTTVNISDCFDVHNKDEEELIIPLGLHIFSGIAMSVLIVLAVVGNFVVILSFIKDKQLRTVYNMYIVSLAVCDLFLGSISMPFYAHFTLNKWVWVFGKHFCLAWSVNDYVFCLETIFLTILLSYDRVLLVTKGMKYIIEETKFIAGVKIAISFCVAFGTYGSCIVGWEYWRGYSIVEEMCCDVEFNDNFYFNIAIAIYELTLPFVALSILNCIIFWQIRKRTKVQDSFKANQQVTCHQLESNVHSENVFSRLPADNSSAQNNSSTTFRSYQLQRKVERDKKAAISLAILVITFLILWGPYTIIQVVKNICENCVNKHIDEFFVWFLWAKSAINPFLYALRNNRFKINIIGFLPFLKCFCKGNTNNRVPNTGMD